MDAHYNHVRVRFAPSPTGHLHIGGLRAALFNWLFARKHQGKFLVRIEDTDQTRSLPLYTQSIFESLAWCSLVSDEPVLFQSERLNMYRDAAEQLLNAGQAYRCYCTPTELKSRLGANASEGDGFYTVYDGWCRQNANKEPHNNPFVIRFAVPKDVDAVTVTDLIRGSIRFPIDTIDDFIVVRSDGYPTYNFCVVIDDHSTNISHVIRGEEHLVNTPRQILLYRACGYALPAFAHLPLILGKDGTKLSKREGATSVIDYKKGGYLPDALCNYLVRLGWSHGDQEIFTRDEMVQLFSFDNVGKSGGIFDTAKLLWLNQVYIKKTSAQDLVKALTDIDQDFRQRVSSWHDQQLYALVDVYKPRSKTVVELRDALYGVYDAALVDTRDYASGLNKAQVQALDVLLQRLPDSEYSRSAIETMIKEIIEHGHLSFSEIAQPLRVALTGSTTAPGIYDLLLAYGREESLRRLRRFAASIVRDE